MLQPSNVLLLFYSTIAEKGGVNFKPSSLRMIKIYCLPTQCWAFTLDQQDSVEITNRNRDIQENVYKTYKSVDTTKPHCQQTFHVFSEKNYKKKIGLIKVLFEKQIPSNTRLQQKL